MRPASSIFKSLPGAQYANWRVATALAEARGTKRYGFGAYEAPNYDALIDHPVTLGEFALGSFDAHGAKHDIVISGARDESRHAPAGTRI